MLWVLKMFDYCRDNKLTLAFSSCKNTLQVVQKSQFHQRLLDLQCCLFIIIVYCTIDTRVRAEYYTIYQVSLQYEL